MAPRPARRPRGRNASALARQRSAWNRLPAKGRGGRSHRAKRNRWRIPQKRQPVRGPAARESSCRCRRTGRRGKGDRANASGGRTTLGVAVTVAAPTAEENCRHDRCRKPSSSSERQSLCPDAVSAPARTPSCASLLDADPRAGIDALLAEAPVPLIVPARKSCGRRAAAVADEDAGRQQEAGAVGREARACSDTSWSLAPALLRLPALSRCARGWSAVLDPQRAILVE